MIERPELLDPRKQKKSGPLWTLLYVFIGLIIAFLVGLLLTTSRYLNVEVSGASMEDTIHDGDDLYAVKYHGNAERGDIIVIDVSDIKHFHSKGDEVYIIKRLIATEGDTVRLKDGAVYITYAGTDEEILLEEPYAKGETDPRPHINDGEFITEWTLEEGEIFVLGDNREVSDDSRVVGPLQRDHIIGVVLDWNFVDPRGWDAFSSPFIRFYLDIVRFFS